MTLIVPYPAGGSTDVVLRALASATARHLGQTVVIENRAGAGGMLGPAQMAATAKPDGYTVSQFPFLLFREPFLRKVTYDSTKDFSYIIGVTGYAYGVVVRSDAPWRTFNDFLADANANPGKITFGVSGSGTNPYVAMVQIAKQRGIEWVPVPFKGVIDSVNALLGGHINAIADSTGWAPQVNSGQFRLLVTFGPTRSKSWPEVPTLKDIGIDMVVNGPYGIAGPRGMDPKIVKDLHDAFQKGMNEPSFTAMLAQFDQEPFYMNSEDYRSYALKKIEEEKRLVLELGLKAE